MIGTTRAGSSYCNNVCLGTWNVQTLYQTGSWSTLPERWLDAAFVSLELQRPTGWAMDTSPQQKEKLVVYSGSNEQRAGVGVIFSCEASSAMISYKPVSARVLYVRIKSSPFNISFLQVYAPTTDAIEVVVEEFYREVQETLHHCPSQDIEIVAGDFNAKVGENSPFVKACGKYGLGTPNDKGEQLINFCYDNDLYITNTAFQHHERRRFTWQSPGDRYRNQVDYILIKRRWLRCVTNSRAYPGADCGSDHNLVSVMVRLRIRRERPRIKRLRLNLRALDNPAMKVAYNIAVNNKFEALRMLEERTPDELYIALKEVVKTTAKEILGREPKRPNRRWISDETLMLMDRRRELKERRRSTTDDELRYQEANRMVQRAARRDKTRWLEEQCAEVENGLQHHNMRKSYDLIKILRKGFQPRQRNNKDREGRLLTDLKDILRRWQEYSKSLYNENNKTMDVYNYHEHNYGGRGSRGHQETTKKTKPQILMISQPSCSRQTTRG